MCESPHGAALFFAFVNDDPTCVGHAVRARHIELHHNFAANEFVRSHNELPNRCAAPFFVSHHVSIEQIVQSCVRETAPEKSVDIPQRSV
jgi:hypothetical protein